MKSVYLYAINFCIVLSLLFELSCKKSDMTTTGRLELSMLDSVNKLRGKGCRCGTDTMPPVRYLIWNNALASAAQAHAQDMYNNNYFDHISPNGSSPIQRAQNAGYTGQYIAENIAEGYGNIADVMSAWKSSPDHCKAMMDPLYIEMGAYSCGSYWVQEFGH